MRHLFHWMKPVVHQKTPDNVIAEGIVTWCKTEYEQKVYIHTRHDPLEDDQRKTYISKYEYECYIDLWMLKVRLAWLGRDQKPPTS